MAGSNDCIMSLSRWQKLMARITPKTVASAPAMLESAWRLIACSHFRYRGISLGHRAVRDAGSLHPGNHSASRAMLPSASGCRIQFPQLQQRADKLAVIAPALQ